MENKEILETETEETETEETKKEVKEDGFFKKVRKKVKTGVTNWLDKPGKTNREKLKTVGTIGAVVGATALAFLVGKEVQKSETLLLTEGESSDDLDDVTEETAEIETETMDDDFDIDVEEF